MPPPGDSCLLARRPWHQAFTPLSRLTLRPPHRPAKCRPSPSPRRSVGSWKVTPWPSPRPPPGPLGSPSGAELAARPETPGAPKTGLSFQLHHPHRLLEPQDFSSPQLCTARFSSCPLRVPFTPLSSTFAFCSGVSTPPRHLRPGSWGAPHVTLRGLGPDPFSLGQPSPPPPAPGGVCLPPSPAPSPSPSGSERLEALRGLRGAPGMLSPKAWGLVCVLSAPKARVSLCQLADFWGSCCPPRAGGCPSTFLTFLEMPPSWCVYLQTMVPKQSS